MTTLADFKSRFIAFRPSPDSRVQLFCFPNAGSGVATLFNWFRGLPPEIHVCPVQLPGRENRRLEPLFTRLDDLVRTVADVLEPYLEKPYALFGHSFGAIVVFELARELRRRRSPAAVRLFVSARRAPQLPHPELGPPIHTLSEEELIRQLRIRYDAIPEAILADEELMKIFLPILRADLGMLEQYVYTPEDPLAVPMSAFGGVEDRAVPEADLEKWREQTNADFRLRMLPGGHFFPKSSAARLLEAIQSDLAGNLR